MRVDSYIVQTPQSLRDSSPSLWEQPEKALFSLREQQKKALPMRQGEYGKAGRGYALGVAPRIYRSSSPSLREQPEKALPLIEGEYGKAGRGYDKQAPRPLSHCVTAPLTYGSSRRLNRSSFTAWLCLVVVLLFVASSCDRRPLEVMEPTKAQVLLNVDWITSFGYKPNGMTVMIWGDGWEKPYTTSTNNVDQVQLDLDPGHYRMIVFNKSFDEFGSLKFTDTDSFENIAVRGADITQYKNGKWDEDVTYMADPEEIGCAVDEFDITDEMLLHQVTFYPYEKWIDLRFSNTRWMVNANGDFYTSVEVKPQITKFNIWVNIEGREYLRSLTGSISGMADGFYMSQVWRTTDERQMLLEPDKWVVTTESHPKGPGLMYYSINVFGLPHGKEFVEDRTPDSNILTLQATLIDGSTRTFTFDVGNSIEYRAVESVIDANITTEIDADLLLELLMDLNLDLDIDIELPEVEPESSQTSSGFDAHVEPWDEGETVDIGL